MQISVYPNHRPTNSVVPVQTGTQPTQHLISYLLYALPHQTSPKRINLQPVAGVPVPALAKAGHDLAAVRD